jgi:hypothetical protein
LDSAAVLIRLCRTPSGVPGELSLLSARNRRSVWLPVSDLAGAQLVSADHFRYELITQLQSAAAQGATTILVNSTELCRSIRNANHSTHACCEAMQAEIKPGDVVIEQKSGTGMTVRYLLPRI